MPDDALFALAGTGELSRDRALVAEVERMLTDPRSTNFISSFVGQWLGLRDLRSHQVEPAMYPAWDEPLRQAMIQEGLLYFSEFLTTDRKWSELLTTDVNFVNARLAKVYQIGGVTGDQPMRMTETSDHRRGLLGLASFLTVSSFSYRTAPTLRGKWVLENLLCEELPPPPPNVPMLDDKPSSPTAPPPNVRVRLVEHRMNPVCAVCHELLDPIGLGLENFDAIGAYRTVYPNGDAIDASGTLPDGSQFSGIMELTDRLAPDARLLECASAKLMTYALSRELGPSDQPFLQQIRADWKAKGFGLRSLVKLLVTNGTFRFRRGQPAP